MLQSCTLCNNSAQSCYISAVCATKERVVTTACNYTVSLKARAKDKICSVLTCLCPCSAASYIIKVYQFVSRKDQCEMLCNVLLFPDCFVACLSEIISAQS